MDHATRSGVRLGSLDVARLRNATSVAKVFDPSRWRDQVGLTDPPGNATPIFPYQLGHEAMTVPLRPEIARRTRKVLLGWLGACLTALPFGLFAIVMIAGPPHDLSDFTFLLALGPALTLAIGTVGLVLAIVAERLGLRRSHWYTVAGIIAVALAASVVFWIMPAEYPRRGSTEAIPLGNRIAFLMTLFAVAAPIGALAGYVYWRIAIRRGEG